MGSFSNEANAALDYRKNDNGFSSESSSVFSESSMSDTPENALKIQTKKESPVKDSLISQGASPLLIAATLKK